MFTTDFNIFVLKNVILFHISGHFYIVLKTAIYYKHIQ